MLTICLAEDRFLSVAKQTAIRNGTIVRVLSDVEHVTATDDWGIHDAQVRVSKSSAASRRYRA